jgi:hypothetical protein
VTCLCAILQAWGQRGCAAGWYSPQLSRGWGWGLGC